MEILNQLISGMNKEDIRYFKLYASRIKSSEARKDIMLFDYIRKSNDSYDEDKIFKKLYGKADKNVFYRLKNRLISDISKCLTMQHYDDEDVVHAFQLLSLARFHFTRNNFKLSFHFIRKAEVKAKKIENYELADIIYGEFIRLSHEIVSIDPEEYIRKRKENQIQLKSLRQIDDVLAAVTYRLKITQNFSEKTNPIIQLLEKTINDFSQDKDIKNSPRLRFKIYSAVSQVLLQKRDYKTLESYLLKTYLQFKTEKLFDKSNHNIKLDMLTYIINSLFKNKKLKLSLDYAEQLKEAMNEYNKMLYDRYVFFYYNSLVINYSVLDKDKAISILEQIQKDEKLKTTSFHEIFIYLNLAVLWFEKQQYHNAVKNLTKLYLHDSYKNADASLKFKIAIAELIMRYELKDFDFLEHKISQVKKDYKEFLAQTEHKREKECISIVNNMMNTGDVKRDKKLVNQIKEFIKSAQKEDLDDTEIIKYNAWLSSKI